VLTWVVYIGLAAAITWRTSKGKLLDYVSRMGAAAVTLLLWVSWPAPNFADSQLLTGFLFVVTWMLIVVAEWNMERQRDTDRLRPYRLGIWMLVALGLPMVVAITGWDWFSRWLIVFIAVCGVGLIRLGIGLSGKQRLEDLKDRERIWLYFLSLVVLFSILWITPLFLLDKSSISLSLTDTLGSSPVMSILCLAMPLVIARTTSSFSLAVSRLLASIIGLELLISWPADAHWAEQILAGAGLLILLFIALWLLSEVSISVPASRSSPRHYDIPAPSRLYRWIGFLWFLMAVLLPAMAVLTGWGWFARWGLVCLGLGTVIVVRQRIIGQEKKKVQMPVARGEGPPSSPVPESPTPSFEMLNKQLEEIDNRRKELTDNLRSKQQEFSRLEERSRRLDHVIACRRARGWPLGMIGEKAAIQQQQHSLKQEQIAIEGELQKLDQQHAELKQQINGLKKQT